MTVYRATNVRLGFATNSSSTHSVVLGPGTYQPAPAGRIELDDYGWEHFRLDSSSERVSYLATAVWQSLQSEPDWLRRAVITELFPALAASRLPEESWDAYIDHQSAFTFGDFRSPAFLPKIREAMEFFTDDRVTIHGGNDNDSEPPVGDLFGDEHDPIRVRRDGDRYVVFNTRTGAKVRLAPAGQTFGKSTRPELVDVKMTNHCVFGCRFCYQGSTPDGAVGDLNVVRAVIRALGVEHLGVFEVALGGGEPTGVPHFVDTIKACHDEGIVPNFTTFSVDWLLDPAKVEAAASCGGIGVSVHNAKQLWRWQQIRDRMPPTVQVVAQHVYGTLDAEGTERLLQECGHQRVPLLLLGYKRTGFGANVEPNDLTDWVARLKARGYLPRELRLSVDTAMVQSHPEFLDAVDARQVSVSRVEGAFSCYVDATTLQVGPSSYGDPSQMAPLPKVQGYRPDVSELAAGILAAYRGYPGESA